MIKQIAVSIVLKVAEYGGEKMLKSIKEKKMMEMKRTKDNFIQQQCVNGFLGGVTEGVAKTITIELCQRYLK